MGEVYPIPVTYLLDEVSPGYCPLMPTDPVLIACESVEPYVPRNPEESLLYGVVAGHLETFLARQRERERTVPWFVEKELRSFLDCGILAHGFVRVHCDTCHQDRLVPFARRKMGILLLMRKMQRINLNAGHGITPGPSS